MRNTCIGTLHEVKIEIYTSFKNRIPLMLKLTIFAWKKYFTLKRCWQISKASTAS